MYIYIYIVCLFVFLCSKERLSNPKEADYRGHAGSHFPIQVTSLEEVCLASPSSLWRHKRLLKISFMQFSQRPVNTL